MKDQIKILEFKSTSTQTKRNSHTFSLNYYTVRLNIENQVSWCSFIFHFQNLKNSVLNKLSNYSLFDDLQFSFISHFQMWFRKKN